MTLNDQDIDGSARPHRQVAPQRSPWKSGRVRPGEPQPARIRGDWAGFPEESGAAFGCRRDTLLRRALAAVDIFAAAISLVVALVLIGAYTLSPWAALACIPLVPLAAKASGLYDRDENLIRKSTLDEAPLLLAVSALYGFVVFLAGPLLVEEHLGRGPVMAAALITFVALMVGRALARSVTTAATAPERCLVVGSAEAAARLAAKLDAVHGVKAEIVGRVSLARERSNESLPGEVPLLGDIATLGIVLSREEIERAIIAFEGPDSDELLHTIRLVKALGVKVSVLPRLLEVVGSASTYDDIDGLPLLGVRRYGLSRSSGLLKRTLDIGGAAAVLFLLGPLLAAIAIAIKLDSPGPVLFRQRRIGKGGKAFDMLKFRSMVNGADGIKDDLRALNEAVGLFKIRDDPRITRMGSVLRRTSLDELPQLFNVLIGHMSLVGPRPLVPDEDKRIEGWQRRRLNFRPGMTGMWQVFGASRIPMHEMVKIDYLYGANWSVWRDVKILARTVPVVFGRRGL